jgi:hypothetical protein
MSVKCGGLLEMVISVRSVTGIAISSKHFALHLRH